MLHILSRSINYVNEIYKKPFSYILLIIFYLKNIFITYDPLNVKLLIDEK